MNIIICGINGAMGKVLKQEVQNYDDINVIGSLSPRKGNYGQNIKESADVVIDFSNPANLDFLIDYAKNNKCALLICTTDFTKEQKNKMADAGNSIPVLISSNTSFGINVLRKILKSISAELNDFDINIVEKHHNKKKDSPSGTAVTLAEDIMEETGRDNIETLSVRAGTIPGEHTVMFSGVDEVLEIKHTAFSKRIFARGALDLALKLSAKPAGFYSTEDFFE